MCYHCYRIIVNILFFCTICRIVPDDSPLRQIHFKWSFIYFPLMWSGVGFGLGLGTTCFTLVAAGRVDIYIRRTCLADAHFAQAIPTNTCCHVAKKKGLQFLITKEESKSNHPSFQIVPFCITSGSVFVNQLYISFALQYEFSLSISRCPPVVKLQNSYFRCVNSAIFLSNGWHWVWQLLSPHICYWQ